MFFQIHLISSEFAAAMNITIRLRANVYNVNKMKFLSKFRIKNAIVVILIIISREHNYQQQYNFCAQNKIRSIFIKVASVFSQF